ncbi:MAG: hypothetical protein ACKPE6_11590 [Gammaproteobacteria bacterium]
MKTPDIESLRNQLHMLERAVRAVRANLEALTLTPTEPEGSTQSLIDCALGNLLTRPLVIDRRTVGPYESITEGVCVAFPPRSDVVGVTVESRSFSAEEAGKGAGSSCLLLRVQRKGAGTPAWATLEADIDAPTLTTLSRIQARMILSFQSRGWRPLGSYRVLLRLFFDKEYKDYFPRTIPALDVPIEASYRIGPEDYAMLPRVGVQSARLIIGLPMVEDADYVAALSFFEVHGN